MKVLRFAFLGLCLIGVAACGYASAKLVGWVPTGKLAPYPPWTVVHFASATAFSLLVPFQFWRTLRSRRPGLHRAMGRTGVALGAVMAVSGIAMAYTSPDRPLTEAIFMTAFFLVYATLLGLGLRAALRRDFADHRAWMGRMTAAALTPVTQRLVFPPMAAAIGIDGMETFWEIFVSAAWMAWGLNMVVAEAWLRGPQRRAGPVPA
jgi:uncharacterized membrane protein